MRKFMRGLKDPVKVTSHNEIEPPERVIQEMINFALRNRLNSQYSPDGWHAWEVQTENGLDIVVVTHDNLDMPIE